MTRLLHITALLCALCGPAMAEPGRVLSVVDGDTVRVEMAGQRVTIRLAGIDSAETGSRAKCARERQLGEMARDEARRLLPVGSQVEVIRAPGKDRYGRILARIEVGGVDFGRHMLARGLAVAYYGRGIRKDWCR